MHNPNEASGINGPGQESPTQSGKIRFSDYELSKKRKACESWWRFFLEGWRNKQHRANIGISSISKFSAPNIAFLAF